MLDWDGLFWGDRSIESMAANQLDAIVYPKAVAMAVWTFWNVLLQRTKTDISKALGFDTPKEQEVTWQSALINRGKEQSAFGTTGKPSQGPGILAPPVPPNKLPQGPSSDFTGLFRKPGENNVPMSPSMAHAFQAASLTLAKNWRPREQPVNRGCIRIDGLVEIQGKSAIMVVYVAAWYDPRVNKYMNVQATLKHLVQSQQRPMGGR